MLQFTNMNTFQRSPQRNPSKGCLGNLKLWLSFPFVTAAILASSQTGAQVLPAKSWLTRELPGFTLIYDAQNQPLADLYAERLSKLQGKMSTAWSWQPEKTVVVINDRTDITNGYATFLPYPLIMIFPVVPGPMETIGEYKDWAWEITTHEYTHILEFEQRRGVVWGLSYVFGTIMTPNALLPTWSLEGAAVESETRLSNAGRLRSKMQAGILRALEAEGVLGELRQAEINETAIPTWPYGSRPYLYGSILWSDWVADKDPSLLGKLHQRTGGRVPYMLEGAYQPEFSGKGPVQLFEESKADLRLRLQNEISALKSIPPSEGQVIDPEMLESFSPAISPDGLKLAYIAKGENLRRRIQVLVRPNHQVAFDPSHRIQWFGKEFDQSLPSGSPLPRLHEDAPPGGNINRISWAQDSQSFIFDQVSERNRFEEVSDLWNFNLINGKAERLSDRLRAREATYSVDGKKVAYVEITAGATHLSLFDPAKKTSERVFTATPQGRVSFPSWISDQEIAFSLREQGKETACLLDLREKKCQPILAGWNDPQFLSRDGDRLLFTATNNGVRNLYAAPLSALRSNPVPARPLTHSLSHVLSSTSDLHLHKIYYTEMTAQALKLKQLDWGKSESLPAQLPVVQNSMETRYPTTPALDIATSPDAPEKAESAPGQPYSPWPYLRPYYWLPMIAWDSTGTYASLTTSGVDPLKKHSYGISANYNSAIRRGSYSFSYSNQVWWPELTLSSYDYSLQLANLQEFSRYQSTSLTAAWEVESVSPDWYLGVGLSSGQKEKFGVESQRQGVQLMTTYQNATQSGYQISPERGWGGTLNLFGVQDKVRSRNVSIVEGSFNTFWSKWLPRHHVLMLKAQGRYSDEPLSIEQMEQSVSSQSTNSTPIAEYLNRGYPTGTFLGRNILGTTLEYRFPLSRLDMGWDGWAFYLHRWHGALVADALWVDGLVYDYVNHPYAYVRTNEGKPFSTVGAELRFDLNLGYHIPLKYGIGAYWPTDTRFVPSGALIGSYILL